MIDFKPQRIAALWHAAASMLPAVEVRFYCRTSDDLGNGHALAEDCHILLVDRSDHLDWLPKLQGTQIKHLLRTTVVIAGLEPLEAAQSTLLRAGYADFVCVQDDHARTIVSATIKAYLRQLRAKQIELPAAIATPIQRALV